MKFFIMLLLCAGSISAFSQSQMICGTYGNANGVSNWNWELTSLSDPGYTPTWSARTGPSEYTPMGSPFTAASTGVLDIISQKQDYTKEKGWELIRRDFGCTRVTAYPYFVLYNKYTSIMRIFVYQPVSQPLYSGLMAEIIPTQTPYPAVTSLADPIAAAAGKFGSTTSGSTIGRKVVAVGNPGGSSRWSLLEFNPGFDPYISNAIFTGSGLQFTIYGVTNFNMVAAIRGRSITTTDIKVYNFAYRPKSEATSNNGSFDFKGEGQHFTYFGRGIQDLANTIQTASDRVKVYKNSVNPQIQKLANVADGASKQVSDLQKFTNFLSTAASFISGVGTVLNFVGGLIGGFGGGSALPTTYTSIEMKLEGTITGKDINTTFVIWNPGAPQPSGDNANGNGAYYNCPVGIFAVKNTPQADLVTYDRLEAYEPERSFPSPNGTPAKYIKRAYKSYKITNDLQVAFNDGAGLECVSVKAAIVGEVEPKENGTASFDPLSAHLSPKNVGSLVNVYINHLLPDFENDRLIVTRFDDVNGLHTFQTPFVDLGCLKGLTFNTIATTKVYLRVQAILKRKNDPAKLPVFFIKDYEIETTPATISEEMKNNYVGRNGTLHLPPFTNLQEVPLYESKVRICCENLHSNRLIASDNSILIEDNTIVNSGETNVVVRAGGDITYTNFTVGYGADFSSYINKYSWNLNCGAPQIQAYQHTGNCYDPNVQVQLTGAQPFTAGDAKSSSDEGLSIFPVPSRGLLELRGNELLQASVVVVDQAGRVVYQLARSGSAYQKLNLAHLPNGIYFLKIGDGKKTTIKKFTLNK